MRDFFARRRPSPAMAIAFVALLAALSGTAIALPGTNTVNSGDIVNNTVRGKDIRNGTVGGKDIKNGSVKSADVGDNSLTGTDINESTLGQVPNANHANSADSATTAGSAGTAGSLSSQTKISYKATAGGGATPIFSGAGLTLTASCAATGALTLAANTSVDHAAIQSYGNSSDTNDDDFLTSETLTLSSSDEERDVVYHTSGGAVVVIQYAAAETTPYAETDTCTVRGLAQTL